MRRIMHDIWAVLKPVGEVLIAVVILAVLIVVSALKGGAPGVKSNLTGFVIAATSSATTGPLPGDQAVIPGEVSCIRSYAANPANNYVGYLPAIGAPEHTDNTKSGAYPCATFTGSYSGKNQVYQYRSQTTYSLINFVNFAGPNAGYLQGGAPTQSGSNSSSQFVARFDPATGQQIWRTYLTNVNTTGQFIAFGSQAIINDGTMVTAAGHTFWKLDPKTGAILASQAQPIIGSPATDANLDGIIVAPDKQGTLLSKTQNRPVGCPTQGNFAIGSCVSKYGNPPNTTVVAADPKTLKNLAAIEVNQQVQARGNVTEHNGKIYMYTNGTKSLLRVIWNPRTQTLTQDKSWEPNVLFGGLTGGAAPAIMGNWIIADSNANPSKTTPQCIFAVSQDNPKDVHTICPWGKKFPVASGATSSEAPALPGIDAANNLIYVQDYELKGIYALRLNQQTGDMKVAWSRPDVWSGDYFSMVGPANQRVLISQNLNPSTTTAQVANNFSYTESLVWMNAATGKTIAQSAFNPSTAIGSLINVGYGGRVYTMGNAGTLFIYQVAPCSSTAKTPAVPQSTTHC